MKQILLSIASLLIGANVAYASCRGGVHVSSCEQLSGGSSFTVRGNSSLETESLYENKNRDLIETAKNCKYKHTSYSDNSYNANYICQSANYTYKSIFIYGQAFTADDPYEVGAYKIGEDAGFNDVLIVQNKKTKNRIILGCRGYIECPKD